MLQAIRKGKPLWLTLRLSFATLTGFCLLFGKAEVKDSGIFNWIGSHSATAQQPFRAQDAWRQVYERLPNLPLENQYVNKETGEVSSQNTLVSRLIQYHVYVKSRPPNFRFDWKLTLADYLGAHEYLVESAYPGATSLRENPMERDRAVIEKLTRAEREVLIDALVSVFTPNTTQTPASAPTPSPTAPTRTSNPATTPATTPSLPQPGDAQLLLP
ncbi:MAG: hypothetical protein F6K28_34185 [Microcoleus sp. SIO2G3]|nr:hypothetical protein [Microcoleus sp. SIO2G3]